MTFAARESSRSQGQPITLYLFQGAAPDVGDPYFEDLSGGSIGTFAYTDAETEIVRGGVTFLPVAISRSDITSSGTLDKSTLEIRCQQGLPLADLFIAYSPEQVVNLIVLEGHAGDNPETDFVAIWSGRILAAQHPPNETVYTAEQVATSIKRPGLRRNWQISCPHALYGPQCKANRAAATVISTVVGAAGNQATLAADWNAHPVQKYRGGMLGWTNAAGALVLRTILHVESDVVLHLSGPVIDLVVGAPVQVMLGCNRRPGILGDTDGDCLNLHNNIVNYGGQPFIPTVNPVGPINNFN